MAKLTVEDTSLTAVADAIRTKGGTTDSLVFPEGFVSAIEGISSGGETTNILTPLVDRSITELTADMLAGCKSIGRNSFYYCQKLKSIVIPESVTELVVNAFAYCTSLTSIVIPESVTSIGTNVFQNCTSLTSIVIPSAIAYIGAHTFSTCSNLISIVIPERVSGIASNAFANCTSLTTVEMKPTTPPTLQSNSFIGCSALKTIIVPAGRLNAYQTATNWSTYADLMVEAS